MKTYALIVGGLLLIATMWICAPLPGPSLGQGVPPARAGFEYQALTELDLNDLDRLNDLGARGWEVVGVSPDRGVGNRVGVILKRARN